MSSLRSRATVISEDKKSQSSRNQKELEDLHKQKKKGTRNERGEKGQGKKLKDYIYGGLDGIITTFAIVSGVAGANLSSSVVLILGFANLLADGLSMAGIVFRIGHYSNKFSWKLPWHEIGN
jgi:hypothetical protein